MNPSNCHDLPTFEALPAQLVLLEVWLEHPILAQAIHVRVDHQQTKEALECFLRHAYNLATRQFDIIRRHTRKNGLEKH